MEPLEGIGEWSGSKACGEKPNTTRGHWRIERIKGVGAAENLTSSKCRQRRVVSVRVREDVVCIFGHVRTRLRTVVPAACGGTPNIVDVGCR